MKKPVIFISHISKDVELAEVLKDSLTEDFLEMIEVFVSSDDSSIQLGRRWLDEVDRALKEAEVEIILCSKDSIQRPWVNFEAGVGWERGISIVPICHTDLKLTELPIPLNLLQAIELNEKGVKKLYSLIADKMGGKSGRTDFNTLISKIKEVEKKYIDEKIANMVDTGLPSQIGAFPTIRRVTKPKILCASSSQFETLGFEKDLATIEAYFPGQVVKEHHVTAKKLRNVLTEQQFDILHILAFITKSGDLVLGNITQSENQSVKADSISPEGFAKLIEVSKIKLVVLATCDSLSLAAALNRKTNFIAAMDTVGIDEIIDWQDCFYGFLSKGFSVAKSFELSKSLHALPMILIPETDIAFASER